VVKLDLGGHAKTGQARVLVLTGDPNGENSLQAPTAVVPSERTLDLPATGPLEHTLPANSLTVLRLPVK
jgi:alpha-L-arabinofuranosidase